MSNEKIVQSFCNMCGHRTKHFVVATRERKETEEVMLNNGESLTLDWLLTSLMLECCGCEDITLNRVISSEDTPGEVAAEGYYPPRVSRREPTWFKRLPKQYTILVKEVYSSLHADNRYLSAMGARAIIDLFIFRKVGDCGNFTQGMNKLVEKGYITNRNRSVIESAIEAGHAASHRAYCPSPEQLNSVMDIVESLIQQDLLEESAKTLRKTIPKRRIR